jgi:hypothetical protein
MIRHARAGGIQFWLYERRARQLDSRLRGNDELIRPSSMRHSRVQGHDPLRSKADHFLLLFIDYINIHSIYINDMGG